MKFKFYLLYCLITINILFFSFYDFKITVAQSYTFLNGHITDFFDVNKVLIPFDKAPYLPFLYFLFSIWNFPLYIFNLISATDNWNNLSIIELIWNKLFIFLIFTISSKFIYKISFNLTKNTYASKFNQFYFFTSPLSLFIITILGCYDIFSVFFTLLGIFYLFHNRIYLFIVFFSIAISFKFFALFIFFPIILLIEKSLYKIFIYIVLGLSFSIIQILLYQHSNIFLDNILFWRINGLQPIDLSYYSILKIFIGSIIYLFVLFYSYFIFSYHDKNYKINIIILCLLSYASLFYAVRVFHIQWAILIIPFFSILVSYLRNLKLLIILDILGFIAFIWIAVNQSPGFTDFNLLKEGALSYLLPSTNYFYGNIYMIRPLYLFFGIIFAMYLISPVILYFYNNTNYRYFSKISLKILFIFRFLILFILFVIPSFLSLLINFQPN